MVEYYQYTSFGLGIYSTILFPELSVGNISQEVKIYYDDDISCKLEYKEVSYGNSLKIQYNNVESIVIYDGESILKVNDGKEIIVNSKTNLPISFIRTLILSQGMGILLQQRGYLVLHANTVKMGNGAVIFIGLSGNGKSTITFALNTMKYPLIADDVLVVKSKNNKFLAFPSFPRIKLWQDITENFIDNSDSLHLIHPDSCKFSYSTDVFFPNPLQIKKIYMLEKGESNEIISLRPQEALMKLIMESYNFKMFNDYEKLNNFFQCVNLIKSVPINILKINQAYNEIYNIVELIEKDIFKETK